MKRTKISMIAAIGKNRELGKDNKLLWHIPEDLKRFRQLTQNHAVIMGRKTYESIGRPLPNRINIIISKNPTYKLPNYNYSNIRIIVAFSLEEAIRKAKEFEKDEIFIIGGGQIFKLALPYADKLYLTIVEGTYEADTYFPDFSTFKNILQKEKFNSSDYTYSFITLEK